MVTYKRLITLSRLLYNYKILAHVNSFVKNVDSVFPAANVCCVFEAEKNEWLKSK